MSSPDAMCSMEKWVLDDRRVVCRRASEAMAGSAQVYLFPTQKQLASVSEARGV